LLVELVVFAVSFRESAREDTLDEDLSLGGGLLSSAMVSLIRTASGMAFGSLT
jgi:hypothetical protein